MSALIEVNRLAFIGADLYRPECVQTHPDGSVHVADWRGGVTIIKPDGQQNTVLANLFGESAPILLWLGGVLL